jgi:hypothetical protein
MSFVSHRPRQRNGVASLAYIGDGTAAEIRSIHQARIEGKLSDLIENSASPSIEIWIVFENSNDRFDNIDGRCRFLKKFDTSSQCGLQTLDPGLLLLNRPAFEIATCSTVDRDSPLWAGRCNKSFVGWLRIWHGVRWVIVVDSWG